MSLAEGDPIPEITLPRDGGGEMKLRELVGAPTVIYFYPKDDTPGCTREACGFRDAWDAVQALGVQVVGVSRDSPKRHDTFRSKYELPFPLLSDQREELCARFGVLKETTRNGQPKTSVQRSTFLVDADGVIQTAWRGVKVDGHIDQVLAAARELVGATRSGG